MTIRPFSHFPPPPTSFGSLGEVAIYLRRLVEALRTLRRGKTENVVEVTLASNASTTTITDNRLSPQSVVCFDPKTANAAAELAAGTMYVLTVNRGDETWTITHANNSQTDRTFQAAIIG